MPTFKSVPWNGMRWPNSRTPVPNGITAKARKAGTRAATGATR